MMSRLGPVMVLLLAVSGCGGSSPAPATERLWVSALPKDARAPFTAFVTVRASEQRYYGSFYHGSMFRGAHDAFRWYPRGERQAKLGFLQDGSERTIELAACEPAAGFDLCVKVRGGPYGVERYQSRKRWVVGRRGSAELQDVTEVMAELAPEDADLAAMLSSE